MQESFTHLNVHSVAVENLAKSMRLAFLMRDDDVARYHGYAKALQVFEEKHEFIPLFQPSFYPIVVRKKLKTPILENEPVLATVSWQK